jgi:hypothetical protein
MSYPIPTRGRGGHRGGSYVRGSRGGFRQTPSTPPDATDLDVVFAIGNEAWPSNLPFAEPVERSQTSAFKTKKPQTLDYS